MRASGWLGRSLVVSSILLAAVRVAGAAPLAPSEVPPSLKPWVPWALHGHEAETCPTVGVDEDGKAVCAWAGRLTLTLDARGGRFSQDWQVSARASVPLPGDADHWPLDVKANGKPVAVTNDGDLPSVDLPPGRYAVAGSFQWRSVPESLRVPNETGLVAV